MISRPLTRVVNSIEMNVLSTPQVPYPSFAEGMALVRTNGQQPAGVSPSTGLATDIFVGFAFAGTSAYPFTENYFNKVETFIVQGGQVSLSFVPVGAGTAKAQVEIFDQTTQTQVTTFTTTAGSTVVSGLTTGDTVVVTYKFATSVIQEVAIVGNVQPGGYSGALVGQIGVITRGVVYTTEFDASVNWSTVTTNIPGKALVATDIVLGANGQLTTFANSATGNAFPGFVVHAPDTLYPFLGVEFSAAA
jgi:hypothetical protein